MSQRSSSNRPVPRRTSATGPLLDARTASGCFTKSEYVPQRRCKREDRVGWSRPIPGLAAPPDRLRSSRSRPPLAGMSQSTAIRSRKPRGSGAGTPSMGQITFDCSHRSSTFRQPKPEQLAIPLQSWHNLQANQIPRYPGDSCARASTSPARGPPLSRTGCSGFASDSGGQ